MPGATGRRLHAEFARFRHPRLDPSLVRTSGIIEWIERLASRVGARPAAHWLDTLGNRRFASALASQMDSPERFALWGYNGSSEAAFIAARAAGRACILDRTSGDYRAYNAMMADLTGRFGEWFATSDGFAMPEAKIAADQREYALADRIVVGSQFAARTIIENSGDPAIAAKLTVLNYCYDEAFFADSPAPAPAPRNAPVKFLYLGLVIPSKGVHHALEAIARIPRDQAELTVVGGLAVPRKMLERYADRITYVPAVPRSEVPRIMQDHHVFLMPSYFEGAGITLYEALASGCALIQSRNCAEAVTPETGILLDRLDTDHLHAAMMQAVEDRDRLDSWRAASQDRAANFTFARYRENIATLLGGMGI